MAKKRILHDYLDRIVSIMKDARNEIGFLRGFLDRSGDFKYVFDNARRLARQKVQENSSVRSSTVERFSSLNDFFEEIDLIRLTQLMRAWREQQP